jgi:hypothetical protein
MQSMEDFYGFNEKGSDGQLTTEATDRMKVYKMMLGMKEKHCTCKGKVFPKAPCDVFRSPDPARTYVIGEQWYAQSQNYFSNFITQSSNAIGDFIKENPGQPPPSNGPAFNKVNHLTPKGAGGCPDNPGNLQPHDLLCATCKMIDNQFGSWQGNDEKWRKKWREAFSNLGIKRRTVANFAPGFW